MNKKISLALGLIPFSLLIANSYAANTPSKTKTASVPEQATGLIFNDKEYEKVLITAPLMKRNFKALPASASLKAYAPIPKSQGQYGTCTSWATSYSARTIALSIKNKNTDKKSITDNAFAPSYVYNQIRLESGCNKGTYINQALDLLSAQGVPKLKDFAYDCAKTIQPKDKANAAAFKIEGYKRLFDIYTNLEINNKIQPVKKALSEKKPVVFALTCCDETFYHPKTDVWQPTAASYKKTSGHAMTVVGYDDKKYGGAFEIMNSWGTDWGNGGFIWIKYPDFEKAVKYAFEMIEKSDTVELKGEVTFKSDSGSDMEAKLKKDSYKMKKSYKSGDLFQVLISNNEPAYVYSFGSDATNKSFRIFPHLANVSSYLGYKQNNVAIPDEDHYIRMDNTTGKDFFCILYSKKQLDLANIMKRMETETGTFNAKLKKILGTDMIATSDINYTKSGKIGFTAKSNGSSVVVPIVVEMQHK